MIYTLIQQSQINAYIILCLIRNRDQHEKHGIPFFTPPQHASQCTLPKKLSKMHSLRYGNTVPLLNTMEILTVQSVGDFKIFDSTSISPDCLPAGLP